MASRLNPAGRTGTRFWGDDGRLVRHARRRSGAAADDKDQTYGYDRNGNRSVDERANSYDYNSRSQLVGWTRRDGSRVFGRAAERTNERATGVEESLLRTRSLNLFLARNRLEGREAVAESRVDKGAC